jgi:hypothetical protein
MRESLARKRSALANFKHYLYFYLTSLPSHNLSDSMLLRYSLFEGATPRS